MSAGRSGSAAPLGAATGRAPTGTPPRRALFWPVFLVVQLGLLMGGLVYMVLRASDDPSFGVERDYYQKSLAWDARQASLRASATLGWSFVADGARSGAGTGGFEVRLVDAGGQGLDGATITLEAFHLARSSAVLEGTLVPQGDGRYKAPFALIKPGMWELRLAAARGGRSFLQQRRVEITETP